jgi:hypothetical protein
MLLQVEGAVLKSERIVRNAIHSGTRSAYAASGRRLGCSGLFVDRFALSQAPRIIMYSDVVSDELRLEPTPSVEWQCRPVSVQHLLQRDKRNGGCSRQAVVAGQNVRDDQYIREEISVMELECKCFMMHAFPEASLRSEFWDPS